MPLKIFYSQLLLVVTSLCFKDCLYSLLDLNYTSSEMRLSSSTGLEGYYFDEIWNEYLTCAYQGEGGFWTPSRYGVN